MKNCEFKFKNIYNMTDDEVKGMSVNIDIGGNLVLVGVLTRVEDDYVYGFFNHEGGYSIMDELSNEVHSMSLEIGK